MSSKLSNVAASWHTHPFTYCVGMDFALSEDRRTMTVVTIRKDHDGRLTIVDTQHVRLAR